MAETINLNKETDSSPEADKLYEAATDLASEAHEIASGGLLLFKKYEELNENLTNWDRIHSNTPFKTFTLVFFVACIVFGLEYLHNSGFYHNDIKPGNILMDDQFNAVLADYGIAGFSASISPVKPKNSYKVHRAPETSGGTPIISIHSDIFQVGCTAYRLLNGISNLKNEFIALGSVGYEEKKAKGKIPDGGKYQPFVPSRLKTIINKSLNIDPSTRYASALEMRRKLEKLHFPGYWTIDTGSNLIGVGKKYSYQFEVEAIPGYLFNLQANKKSVVSGNITKVKEFTDKKLTEKQMEKLRNDFISWVVENAN